MVSHIQQLTKFLPLLESTCSKHIRFLICSSIFPLCSPDVPRPVTACRSLCEKVKKDCATEPLLNHLWPDFLNCEILPQPEKQELCMQIPDEEIKIDKNPNNGKFWPSWLPWKVTANGIISGTHHSHHHHHHHSHHTGGINIDNSLGLKIICPVNFTAYDRDCIPQCNTDAIYNSQQKKITQALILSLSAVCFILTLFSLVTFWAEPTRFGYPERPVLFLCLCYNLLSVSYLERIVFHNPIKEKFIDNANDEITITVGCTIAPPCLASYITTSYLMLCAASWWLIFALCFYLSSNKKWSSEALEKKSGLFHVLAWVTPLGPPIGALLWGAVKSNELTGMCTAPGFVEIPAIILLIFGATFTMRASRSLQNLQEEIRTPALTNNQFRFSQIRKRVLIFSLVFFIPTVIAILLTFFERLDVRISPCISIETCEQPKKSSAIPTYLKLFFQLTGGTLTGMWVWSRKTCESYRSRIVTATTPTISSTSTKSGMTIPNKKMSNNKHVTPLYSGINFHNVPVYNSHSRV
ncbi:frizzled-3 isoform X2 [Condylostylus longicornis]|uniref:frizzled-3 isoform X2 n=1 Tax=Condylostylus longicornis TaxID=2530218 RepID=UPI00244E13B6|nr:frizzled-3 isoform X2 [Condylostylus longicornis]